MLILPEIAINVVCEEQGEQILCLLWIIARSLPDFVRAIEKGVPVDEQAVSRLADIKIVLHQTLNYLPHVRLGKDGCRVFGKDALQKEASRVPVQMGNTVIVGQFIAEMDPIFSGAILDLRRSASLAPA